MTHAAIESLRPGKPYVLRGDDVEGIEWLNSGVKPLTAAEVDAEAARLEAEAAERAAAREAGLRKIAESSGLTADELSALGL